MGHVAAQNPQSAGKAIRRMTDTRRAHGKPALSEAKQLMAAAESHERRVALREESARFLDGRGESEGAEHERREADLERDAARNAWDRAAALQGPTQMTKPNAGEPLEIPIPTRGDFLRNLEKVAPKPEPATKPKPNRP
jgi:hypothetical protein